MTPTRMIIRTVGFFLIPLCVVLVTYPLLQVQIEKGREAFLTQRYSGAELKALSQREGFLSILPIRLYFAQVYRSCRSELKALCEPRIGSEAGTRCLLERPDQLTDTECRELLGLTP